MGNSSEPAMQAEDANAIMQGWALHELAPWLSRPTPRAVLDAAFDKLAATEPDVFVFHIRNGQVILENKLYIASHYDIDGSLSRAKSYQLYLQDVVKSLPVQVNTRFAIFTGDGALDNPTVPVFSFQKPSANASLLIPDPDMLGRGFPTAKDQVAYGDKSCAAIFAGGTSGGTGPITIAALKRDGAIPRIRAALRFKPEANVHFHLPIIVQYDNDETAAYLKNLGFGDGKSVDWNEQLRNKFIISIDGNGATCTRVSITLSSNSILAKYTSDSVLYYFQGLMPWVHYIPIVEHDDLLDAIALEQKFPGIFESIPSAAQSFAKNFLTREATLGYTAFLFAGYAQYIYGMAPPIVSKLTSVDIVAHVQNYGDIAISGQQAPLWIGQPGSAIEGFSLWPKGDIQLHDISYSVIYLDGLRSTQVTGGGFAGTTGQQKPIHGMLIALGAGVAGRWRLRVEVGLSNGTILGPRIGDIVFVPAGAPTIERFRIEFERLDSEA